MQHVLSHIRRAVDDYNMIEEGDRIAVGVSGGKDSITLALGLCALQRFYPKKFETVLILLDMGYDNADFSELVNFFGEKGEKLNIVKTDIKKIVFDIRQESNPCSLCAKLRRGALHNAALKFGCNKVALGHHTDDAVETFMMSLFFEGRVNCFSPVTFLDRKKLFMIRPLLYMTEADVKGFIKRSGSPVYKNPCTADGNTKRQYIKDLLAELSTENHGLKEHIFTAVKGLPNWQI